MTPDPAWFAERSSLAPDDFLFVTYVFETQEDPAETAAHLCQEQSTAQWKRVGVEEDFRPRHGARVVSLRHLEDSPVPRFPSPFDRPGAPFHRVEVVIAHPHVNFGPKIANLLTALAGEGAFYTPGVSSIRLMHIEYPVPYLAEFPGPQFGIGGLRELLGIRNRPFFIGVVKPNVGLKPEDFAQLAGRAWRGGLDIAKDDEMLADAPWSTIAERTSLVTRERHEAERATGEKKMYVANITDEIQVLYALHDVATGLGANALMLNAFPLGIPAARYLRHRSRVPLLSHFDMIAAVSRVPGFGIEPAVLTTLQRLAGFDIILFPGLGPRMRTSDAEVRAQIAACTCPLGPIAQSLPVPGGSSRPEDLPALLQLCGSPDFGMVPGRAVFEHPGGPEEGARSFRRAWEEIMLRPGQIQETTFMKDPPNG